MLSADTMQLRVLLPAEVSIDCPVRKVIAEAVNGSFCLLPRHVDFVTALVPGLLLFEDEAGSESVVGIDEGILVKCGRDVSVSTRRAVRGRDLESLRETVAREFRQLDKHEAAARSAMARLEAGIIRRFVERKRR